MIFLKPYILLIICSTILFFNCKTNSQLKLESNNNCNFYFYIKNEIKNEMGLFNNIKLKFNLNKKDYSDIILSNLKENKQSTCFNLKSGIQKLELKFNYSKLNSFVGNIQYNLEDRDPYYNTIIILFYIDTDKKYYLTPIPLNNKKINLFESILNFYFILFYPFGFFPNYDSVLKANINNFNEMDNLNELKYCHNNIDIIKCNIFFEKLILENYKNE